MKTSSPVHSSRGYARLLAPVLAVCGLAAFIGGCASEPESHVVSSPPPGPPVVAQPAQQPTIIAQPVASPNGQNTVVVTQAPPAVQSEAVPARPSSEHVWVPGYWTWRNSRYEWVAGRWTVPPRSGVTWIPPRWEQEGGAYRYYEGYWD